MRLFRELGFFEQFGVRVFGVSNLPSSCYWRQKSIASPLSIPAAISSEFPKKKISELLEGIHEHSRRLSNFTHHLPNLQVHFLSIERMIDDRLRVLESEPQQLPQHSDAAHHPELNSICAQMDAKALNSFIRQHGRKLKWDEVVAALPIAPDPAKLVLNSMQWFYPTKMRNFLVDCLASISSEVKEELRMKAKLTAEKWGAKIGKNGEHAPECFAFLQFLALYGLGAEFDADELVNRFAVHVPKARVAETISLCRVFGLSEKIPDLIRKLVSLGKHLQAVNYAYAFDLVGQFPPMPLLKDYLKESKKVAQEVLKKNDPLRRQNEAIGVELKAVKAVINCIEEHNLESEYPLDSLEKRIEHLEKERADKMISMSGSPQLGKKESRWNNWHQHELPAGPKSSSLQMSMPSQLQWPQLAPTYLAGRPLTQLNPQTQPSSLLAGWPSPHLPSARPYCLAWAGAGVSALYEQ